MHTFTPATSPDHRERAILAAGAALRAFTLALAAYDALAARTTWFACPACGTRSPLSDATLGPSGLWCARCDDRERGDAPAGF